MACQCYNSLSGRNRLSSQSVHRCWQECVTIPPLYNAKTFVIKSPIISLMAEQVDFTCKEIVATQIRSAKKNDVMQEVQDGHYRLIYSTNETSHDKSRKQPREVLLRMAQEGKFTFWHWKKHI